MNEDLVYYISVPNIIEIRLERIINKISIRVLYQNTHKIERGLYIYSSEDGRTILQSCAEPEIYYDGENLWIYVWGNYTEKDQRPRFISLATEEEAEKIFSRTKDFLLQWKKTFQEEYVYF